jgi:hypothetical protein
LLYGLNADAALPVSDGLVFECGIERVGPELE